jgi:hypothetical protein
MTLYVVVIVVPLTACQAYTTVLPAFAYYPVETNDLTWMQQSR